MHDPPPGRTHKVPDADPVLAPLLAPILRRCRTVENSGALAEQVAVRLHLRQ